jgi:hypothetical protein
MLEARNSTKFQLLPLFNIVGPFLGLTRNLGARHWYYRISTNFRTLMILLQIDPTSDDEPKTVCEGCYEIEDTSIFAWSLVPSVGHYRWLHSSIRQLSPNSKADYLVHII